MNRIDQMRREADTHLFGWRSVHGLARNAYAVSTQAETRQTKWEIFSKKKNLWPDKKILTNKIHHTFLTVGLRSVWLELFH